MGELVVNTEVDTQNVAKRNKKNVKAEKRNKRQLEKFNIHLIRFPEENGRYGREAIFEEIIADNFQY